MPEILILDDSSQEAHHAAAYAFQLACQYKKDLVIAHLNHIPEAVNALADFQFSEEHPGDVLADQLSGLPGCDDFKPVITELDVSMLNEYELAQHIYQRGVWMIVTGTGKFRLNLQALLNRSSCPILLVPHQAAIRPLERIAYLADLRYAQLPVLQFLSKMNSGSEQVILTHICAKGLPELDNDYALDLFSSGLNRGLAHQQVFLSRLRGSNFAACMDQVIHGMQADLLACSNHHYHFEQMLKGNIALAFPPDITIPILVFPH